MTGELLYDYLSETKAVTRFGRNLLALDFSLPMFYLPGNEPENGRIYICRSSDLPRTCSVSSCFICLGSRPTYIWNNWKGMALYLEDPAEDILSLSNTVTRLFDRVSVWETTMQELISRKASLEDLVNASLPLFENCITITDYSFNILINCGVEGDGADRRVRIVENYARIPEEIAAELRESAAQFALRREPFSYKGQQENPEGDNYCINLYLGNSYFGTCTLWDKFRPMNKRDKLLFNRFAEYVKKALSAQPRGAGSTEVTIKSVFADLLRSFPVSAQDAEWAVQLTENDFRLRRGALGDWYVLVIRSANREKTLPVEYFCASLEDMLPSGTAVALEEEIVCLCPLAEGDTCESTVCDILAPYLSDMNFRMGISAPFREIFQCRSHYLQAAAMLETGRRYAPEQRIYRFSDYILPYMLRHSRGEFEEKLILVPGLRELREMNTSVDYWGTLRLYLDNECNASKTAQDLYLHRSTLLPRLEKIRSMVDLDTPEERLYLRMCITLLDMEADRKKK